MTTTKPAPTAPDATDSPLAAALEPVDLRLWLQSPAPLLIRLLADHHPTSAANRMRLLVRCADEAQLTVDDDAIRRSPDGLIVDLDGSTLFEAAHLESRQIVARVRVGSGSFELREHDRINAVGDLRTLAVRANDFGHFDLRGSVEHADLAASGMAQIAVTRVRRTLRRLCIGSGDVRISFLPPHPLLLHDD